MYFAIYSKTLHVRQLECVSVARVSFDGHIGKSSNGGVAFAHGGEFHNVKSKQTTNFRNVLYNLP